MRHGFAISARKGADEGAQPTQFGQLATHQTRHSLFCQCPMALASGKEEEGEGS